MAMERVTIEQNGERITLEVPEGTTDDQIKSFLGQQQQAAPNPVTTVEPSTGPVAPQFAVPGPTGFGALAQDLKGAGVFTPLAENVTGRVGQYIAKPGKAVIDAATMLGTGMPIAPAAMYDTYKSVQESVPKMRQALGSITDVNPQAFTALTDKLKPADVAKLSDLVSKSGGKVALESFELPAYLAKDAEAVAAFNALKQQAQSSPGMLSRVAGPVMRGVAKVAGPAGLALNAYDAAQYAQESQLGQRLAQGQGSMAQRNFRQMTPGYGAPVSPDEAAAVLENGSARDIAALGGQESLSMAMRLKAAKKVLGQ